MKDLMLAEINNVREYFLRCIRPFSEEDSNFKSADGAYSVAAQIMHIALTVEWFQEGTFGAGFDMNFEEHDKLAKECTSIKEATAKFNAAMDSIIALAKSKSEAELMEPYPADSIIQGPKMNVFFGLIDHTAHHRGALNVYVRLLGKQPAMPYMDL